MRDNGKRVATAAGIDLIGLIVIELPKIILASASPRRAEILRTVGWPFEPLAVDIDESRRDGEDAADYVRRLALDKAEAAAARRCDWAGRRRRRRPELRRGRRSRCIDGACVRLPLRKAAQNGSRRVKRQVRHTNRL